MAVKKVIEIDVDVLNAQGGLDKFVTTLQETEKQSVSLKAELRQLKQQLAELPEGTAEYDKIAKRAGEVSDQIGDINTKVKNLGSDTKGIDAIVQGAQTLSGAFSVASSASALLGDENEDLQKTMMKVEAAIGLTVGIQSIANALQKESALVLGVQSVATKVQIALQTAYTAVVGTSTGALKALKVALISTGVGAFVVLLGSLIAAMSNSTEATDELTDAQKRLNKELEDGKQLTADAIKRSDYQTQIAIANAKKRGASESELLAIELEGIKQRGKANQKESDEILATQKNYYDLTKEQQQRLRELRNENIELQRQGNIKIAQFDAELAEKQRENQKKAIEDAKKKQEDANEKQKEELKKQKDALKSIEEKSIKDIEELKAKTDVEKLELQKKRDLQELENVKLSAIQKAEALALINEKYKLLQDELKLKQDEEKKEKDLEADKLEGERIKSNFEYFAEQYDINQKKQLETDKAVADGKKAIQESTFQVAESGISLLKGVFEKNKAIQKGLLLAESAVGIAKIVVATQAANAADKAAAALMGPAGAGYLAVKLPLNKINAGIGIGANIAATSKALSALGGGGAPSAGGVQGGGVGGGGASSAPQFNVVGNTGINQIAQTMNREQMPVQAYVVGNKVTSQQALDRNIVDNASL